MAICVSVSKSETKLTKSVILDISMYPTAVWF